MRFSIELGNEYPANLSSQPHIAELIQQTRLAREFGFYSVLIGQHYLSHPLQHIHPLPLIARLAPEAGDMWLGTGILLLPLLHPVDVAEQVAILDNICNGRFIFGLGLGYEIEEFEAFEIDRKTRVGRFEESLEIIKMLWTEDTVTFHGRHFNIENARPTHRPMQTPHQPIWIAANNSPAIRRAARLGASWFASQHAHNDTLKEQMAVYKEAIENSSAPAPWDISIINYTFVAETDEEAFATCRPFLEHRYNVYKDQGQDKELPTGDRFDMPFEELARDRFLIGSPETVIKEIEKLLDLGFNHIIFFYQTAGLGGEQALNCLRLLGERVLPAFRS